MKKLITIVIVAFLLSVMAGVTAFANADELSGDNYVENSFNKIPDETSEESAAEKKTVALEDIKENDEYSADELNEDIEKNELEETFLEEEFLEEEFNEDSSDDESFDENLDDDESFDENLDDDIEDLDDEKTDSEESETESDHEENVVAEVNESIRDENQTSDNDISDELENAADSESEDNQNYTMDFTYNEKITCIKIGTLRSELSQILSNIDITGEITSVHAYNDEDCQNLAEGDVVKSGETDLFRVYEDNGIWYVDALNAFKSTHGLFVTTKAGQYKVKITDITAFTYLYPVYVDSNPANGISEWKEGTTSSYSFVKNTTKTLKYQWYVVKEDVQTKDLKVEGDVNLLLCDGATLTATRGIVVNSGSSLTIYSQKNKTGTIIATGFHNSAGIGGSSGNSSGTITINGGKITAKGYDKAAGIGGGAYGSGSNITINGGTINATGGNSGAGIGGGFLGNGTNIIINGGTVKATGTIGGAGIGGGDGEGYRGQICGAKGSNITINGGTVTATSTKCGAGIGGGFYGAGTNITINDGMVTATGVYGAGIGGGGADDSQSNGANIFINGGTVVAISDGENYFSISSIAIGYGTSESGACSNIKIKKMLTVKAGKDSSSAIKIDHDDSTDLATVSDFKKLYVKIEFIPFQLSATGTMINTEKSYDSSSLAAVNCKGTLSGEIDGDKVEFNVIALYDDSDVGDNKTITVSYTLTSHTEKYIAPASYTIKAGKIVKATNSISDLSLSDWTYGDTPNNPSASSDFGVINYQYKLEGDSTYSDTKPLDAGNYIVRAYVAETANYNSASSEKAFHIAKKELKVTTQSASKTYDDKPLTADGTYSGLVNNETIGFSVTGSQTNTGSSENTYSITWETAKESNYTISENTGILTVYKKTDNKITGLTLDSWTYGDTPNNPSASVEFGHIVYLYRLKDGELYSYFKPSDAGDYVVKATFAGNINYNGDSATKEFTIYKRQLSVSGSSAEDKVYDGTDEAVAKIGAVLGKVGSDDVTVNIVSKVFENSNVGQNKTVTIVYEITGEKADNYIGPASDTVLADIKPKTVTVTADDKSKTYGNVDPELTASVKGLLGTDTVSYVTARTAGEKVGTYTVTASGEASQGNYAVKYESGSLTIYPKTVTVTADNKSKTYGDKDPELTATVTGLISGDSLDFLLERVAGESAGDYVITPLENGDNINYNVTCVNGTLTIGRKNLTITADSKSKIYGNEEPELTASVTGLVYGDSIDYILVRAKGESIGDYDITPTVNGDNGNYNVTCVNGKLTINQRPVTVTADNKSKKDNETDPELTATVTGLVGSDTICYSLTRTAGEAIGTYAITVSGKASQGNYTVTYKPGTLTINASVRELTVTGTTIYNKSYDGTAKAKVDNKGILAGVADGDEVEFSAVSATFDNANAGSNKTVTIRYTLTEAAGNINKYTVKDSTVQAVISPKSVTVTADHKSKTYGESDPAWTATVDGLIKSTDTISYTFARTAGNDVGTYAITPSGETNQGNYSVTFNPGALTINQKSVTVTADDKSKTYGDTDPTLTATVTGLVGSDTIAYKVTRTAGNDVGTYVIKASAETTSGNYAVTFIPGTLTINQRPVTVTADSKSKIYGEDDPELTTTVNGLVGSDTIAYSVTRAAGNDAGKYTVTAIGETSQGNYSVTYTTGTLTINQKSVTVKADDKSKTYGDTDPTLTTTVTGLVGSDTIAYSVTRAAGNDVGTYTVSATGDASQGNYSVTYTTGTLTINQKSVTVKADDKSKTYGDDDPKLTATVTGLVGTDTISYSVTRAGGSNVGTYDVTASGTASQNNYIVTFVPGTLTITPKNITVTADNKSKTYGDDDPELTATVTGQTEGADAISYSIIRIAGENVGTYTIVTCGDADQGNYCIAYVSGALTVTRKAITAVVDSKSKTYGDADPELTVTATGLVGSDTIDYTITREAGNDVGIYTLTAAESESQGNYTVTFTPGTLTITPKSITVAADDISKTYGDADPELTATVNGLVDSYKISYSVTRTEGNNVGTYAVTVSGDATQGNYSVMYVPGTFSITQRSVLIAADNKNKTYGNADPELTATVTNLVFGDNVDYILERIAGESAGEYVIMLYENSDNTNYVISCKTGIFTIDRIELTLEGVKAADKKYDGNTAAMITDIGKIVGTVLPGDSVIVDNLTAEFADAAAGDNKPVKISFTISGNGSENYLINVADVFASIIPVPPTQSDISGIVIGEVEEIVLNDAQKKAAESLSPNVINYVQCSLFGSKTGYAGQPITLKTEYLKGYDASTIHIWHIAEDGTITEVEFDINSKGEIVIQSGLLGLYVITE